MDVEVPGDDWEVPEEEEEEETPGNPEAHPTKLKPSPTLPSREEVAQHYATHCPYRSWCPICVAASAREDPHRRKTAGRDSESGLPVVAIDYELLEEKITVLVARDLESGATLAYDCEAKGPSDAWMIKQFVKDLEDGQERRLHQIRWRAGNHRGPECLGRSQDWQNRAAESASIQSPSEWGSRKSSTRCHGHREASNSWLRIQAQEEGRGTSTCRHLDPAPRGVDADEIPSWPRRHDALAPPGGKVVERLSGRDGRTGDGQIGAEEACER